MHTKRTMALAAVLLLGTTGAALAEPMLQLYLEGGSYDVATETWVVDAGGSPLRLWVIGNTSSPRGNIIEDVKLSIAYASGETPSFTLTGSTTGDYGSFSDPSTAADPTYLRTVTDGSVPLLSDGTPLAPHGVFGEGTAWQEFSLGDFTLQDSPIADFIDAFPSPTAKMGQINVYEILVEGASVVHFDTYNHIQGANSALFAPFSHDGGTGAVPAPAAVLLALIGIGATSLLRRYFR